MTGVLQHLTALGRDALVEVLGNSVRNLAPGVPWFLAGADWALRETGILRQVARSRVAGPLFAADIESAEAAAQKAAVLVDELALLLGRDALLRTAIQEGLGNPEITTPEHAAFLARGSLTRALPQCHAGYRWLAERPDDRDRMLHRQALVRWIKDLAGAESEVPHRVVRPGLRVVASNAPTNSRPAAAPDAA